jgi:hypothetical protein
MSTEIFVVPGVMVEMWTKHFLLMAWHPKHYRRPFSILTINFYKNLGWLRMSLSFGKYWVPKLHIRKHSLEW